MRYVAFLIFFMMLSASGIEVVNDNYQKSSYKKILDIIAPYSEDDDDEKNIFFREIKNENCNASITWFIIKYRNQPNVTIGAIDEKSLTFAAFTVSEYMFVLQAFFDNQNLPVTDNSMRSEYSYFSFINKLKSAFGNETKISYNLRYYENAVRYNGDRNAMKRYSVQRSCIHKDIMHISNYRSINFFTLFDSYREESMSNPDKSMNAKYNYTDLDLYEKDVIPEGVLFESSSQAPASFKKTADAFFEIQKKSDMEYQFIFDNGSMYVFKGTPEKNMQISFYDNNILRFQATADSNLIKLWSIHPIRSNDGGMSQVNIKLRLTPFEYSSILKYKEDNSMKKFYISMDDKNKSLLLYRLPSLEYLLLKTKNSQNDK